MVRPAPRVHPIGVTTAMMIFEVLLKLLLLFGDGNRSCSSARMHPVLLVRAVGHLICVKLTLDGSCQLKLWRKGSDEMRIAYVGLSLPNQWERQSQAC